MVKLINNVEETLYDDLQKTIKAGSRLSIAASCFSIYAYQALKKELEGIEELRFVFTSPTFIKEPKEKPQREFYIPSKEQAMEEGRLERERSIVGSDFEILLRNELTQRAIARECAEWIRRKVRFNPSLTPIGV
ncbi:hypothetical protein [Porphyromonas somerae]|uniref:hypothetical protein n=1 Tax=Porphyromonas somerae TaxID=322095 RepID=UPI002A7477A5|nr:hypothetical protein [Porphyromonas somerae]MDY3119673.1 hypothetical protein [Porphyromonas somerae]